MFLVPNIMPCIPPISLSGSRVCSKLIGFYHVEQEIWYPEGSGPNAEYIAGRFGEDPKGSDQLGLDRNLPDHLAYFGYNLENYGKANCIDA
jgi:hypothetical protein